MDALDLRILDATAARISTWAPRTADSHHPVEKFAKIIGFGAHMARVYAVVNALVDNGVLRWASNGSNNRVERQAFSVSMAGETLRTAIEAIRAAKPLPKPTTPGPGHPTMAFGELTVPVTRFPDGGIYLDVRCFLSQIEGKKYLCIMRHDPRLAAARRSQEQA